MTLKVEDRMVIFLCQGITGRASENTAVIRYENHGPLVVELHGNRIAEYWPATGALNIYDAGWRTDTTKSRLNALLGAFAPGWCITQCNGKWMLNDYLNAVGNKRQWNGKAQFRDYVCIAS